MLLLLGFDLGLVAGVLIFPLPFMLIGLLLDIGFVLVVLLAKFPLVLLLEISERIFAPPLLVTYFVVVFTVLFPPLGLMASLPLHLLAAVFFVVLFNQFAQSLDLFPKLLGDASHLAQVIFLALYERVF